MKNSPVSFLIITLIVCNMCAASAQKTAKIYKEYLQNPQKSILTDFSYAGYQYGEKEIPSLPIKVNVKDKGILPNTGADLTVSIQNLIDEVGKSGGGVIYFPKGKYCVNMDTTRIQFLKVDYDNVVLRGEGSTTDGTVIFNGSTTIQEKVNPWISPALIRFGYKIQPTEKFWGVAPLKPVIKFVKSASAADPGSDGSIFEAPVLTSITKNSPKGDKKLYVTSTKNIKAGDVIVVAMYNTTPDGNLIKDILNYSDQDITLDLVSVKAAGTEGMASFQHLLEVEAVQGSNVIVLKQPLRRDIQLIYKPVIAGALDSHLGPRHH